MAQIVDYGTDIIDISEAILNHRRGLNDEQLQVIAQIRKRSVHFVTACFQHETSDMITLYNFLSGDALGFVEGIGRASEYLLMYRKLHPAYREAIERIRDSACAIREELTQMKDELIAFMDKIGLQVSGLQSERQQNTRKKLQQNTAFQADYEELEPIPMPPMPTPPQPKPVKPIKPLPSQQPQTETRPAPRQIKPNQPRRKIQRLQPKPS